MPEKTALEIRSLVKSYGEKTVLDGVDLQIYEGEFLTLLGPSGCGKTSTIRVLAGFLFPDRGEVLMDGVDISRMPPQKRQIGMMFQNYALFPHMTVAENVSYGLKVRKWPSGRSKARVSELLDMVQLDEASDLYPSQISGGMAQRVALARALAPEPKIVLMDEPLAALDPKLRKSMQFELKRIQHLLGVTTVYVTHDQEEALTMSDRVVVMNEGRIQQISTATEIYRRPTNRFVADFVGRMNFLPAECIASSDMESEYSVGSVRLVGSGGTGQLGPCLLGIRPESIVAESSSGRSGGTFNGVNGLVRDIVFAGSVVHVIVTVASLEQELTFACLSSDCDYREGEYVDLQWKPSDVVRLSDSELAVTMS